MQVLRYLKRAQKRILYHGLMTEPENFPFAVSHEEIEDNIDFYVDVTFRQLSWDFLILPKGDGYVDYPRFQEAYQVLYNATNAFWEFTPEKVMEAWSNDALSFVVVRTILGLSPPEFAEATYQSTGLPISAGFARFLDRSVRVDRKKIKYMNPKTKAYKQVQAMAEAACKLISEGAPPTQDGFIHRLNKFDTMEGLISVRFLAQMGVSYSMLLYERFLGRPFASHRDAVSDLVGDMMEHAIENLLRRNCIPFRRTAQAERIPGFDQAPDFIIPDEHNPKVVIEAKIAGDEGTARDKIARILRLAEMRRKRQEEKGTTYQLVVCIDGRGFGVRRQDMRTLLRATEGKVFTSKTLSYLIQYTDLRMFRPENCYGSDS